MSIPEIHTFTGAYAVDALTETERASFEDHLPECDPCTTEARSLQGAAATLARLVPAEVPASLRDRVLAQAATTAQLPPARRTRARRAGREQLTGSRLWMAAAASLALVAAGLGALAVNAEQRADRVEARLAAREVTAPDLQIVSEATRLGGTATVVGTGRDAVFAAAGLPAPSAQRTYQLWIITPSGDTESLGLLTLDPRGRLEQVVRALAPGETVALTIEPEGGSQRPTTMPLVTLAADA